jgi:hypothetical protein
MDAVTRRRWILFFASLGAGYITVEIVLIQRFNLYLGNPTYALAVVLFTMLVSSGIGALVAQRFTRMRALRTILTLVCVALGVVLVALDPFVSTTLSGGLTSRIVAAVAFIAPVGFVMGMPFPTGLRHLGSIDSALVPWAWGVNGGTSVLGSVAAVVVSMAVGFTACLAGAVGIYAAALAAVVLLTRSDAADRVEGTRI